MDREDPCAQIRQCGLEARLHGGRARRAAPDSRRRGAAGQARVAIIVSWGRDSGGAGER
jgi:hypothetical protein